MRFILGLGIFLQAKRNPAKDALLADVCIGTSAAPTFLPAHYFETKDKDGKPHSFDLVDGGVAANNPVSKSNFKVTRKIDIISSP